MRFNRHLKQFYIQLGEPFISLIEEEREAVMKEDEKWVRDLAELYFHSHGVTLPKVDSSSSQNNVFCELEPKNPEEIH